MSRRIEERCSSPTQISRSGAAPVPLAKPGSTTPGPEESVQNLRFLPEKWTRASRAKGPCHTSLGHRPRNRPKKTAKGQRPGLSIATRRPSGTGRGIGRAFSPPVTGDRSPGRCPQPDHRTAGSTRPRFVRGALSVWFRPVGRFPTRGSSRWCRSSSFFG